MNDQQFEISKIPLREVAEERRDRVYEYATKRNPDLKGVPSDDLKGTISSALGTIDALEEFGGKTVHNLQIPTDIANEIGLIWDFSGPGTYDKDFKEDRYKNLSWAKGMDRKRLGHTAVLERAIVESIVGESFRGPLENIADMKRRLREKVQRVGPYILYNGTPQENNVVKDVLSREGVVIPAEKVIVPDVKIDNTVDQIGTFKWPEQVGKGKAIALVSHAPHFARIIALINHFKPFPEGTKVYLFPLPSPQEGKEQYVQMEVTGLLVQMFVERISDVEPAYKYILGEEELKFSYD